MKHIHGLILSLLLVPVAEQAGARYADVPDEDIYRSVEERYGHLEYFGFYASAMGSWNFTAELAPFTNLTWIHIGSPDNPERAITAMIRRLVEARDAGVWATLSLEPFLFANDEGIPRPRGEIEDFLVELRARMETEGLLETLAMIYPKDEPFRNFKNERDPDFIEEYITGEVYEDIHRDLVAVNEAVKGVFPDTPIGVILSGHELTHDFFSIPENYDWVGFDCYTSLFDSCDDRTHVEHYAHLLRHMRPHQQLMAVPETWTQPWAMELDYWPDVLTKRFRHHYEIALHEPRFIALIPFLWSADTAEETLGQGLAEMPELFDDGEANRGTAFLERVKNVGRRIKNRNYHNPNMSWSETEPDPRRPASEVRGGILNIDQEGLVSAWAMDQGLEHKNLRMRIVVRDARGQLLHKSRAERTNIRDHALVAEGKIGWVHLGTKGYRYRLPLDLLREHHGRTIEVELRIYPDGREAAVGVIDSRRFVAPWPKLDMAPGTSVGPDQR